MASIKQETPDEVPLKPTGGPMLLQQANQQRPSKQRRLHSDSTASLLSEIDSLMGPVGFGFGGASGNNMMMAAQQANSMGLPAHIQQSDVAGLSNVALDVESILADVRGAIGQSLAQVNQTQSSSLGGPSSSNVGLDDSMDESDDDNNNDNNGAKGGKRKKGLPPTGPSIPSGLNQEDQKKLRRRISNRECARRIRQRRQEQLSTLTMRIETLRGENAKLMVRLTEVMKCWHDVAGQNRSLKEQLVAIQKYRGDLANSPIIQELMRSGVTALTEPASAQKTSTAVKKGTKRGIPSKPRPQNVTMGSLKSLIAQGQASLGGSGMHQAFMSRASGLK